MNTQTKTLGARIREAREHRGISLRELARRLKLSAPFVSDVELGRRFPSKIALERIAKILDVPLDEIRRFDERPPIEDLKRLTATNPCYAVAFRALIQKKVSAEDLIKLAARTKP